MAFDRKQFIARFVEEAKEHLNRLNDGLVILESSPEDVETINTVFRSAHTIKGSSRMLGLAPVSEVAHKLEDVLSGVRDGRVGYSKELADILFEGLDAISDMLEKIAASQEIEADTEELCLKLKKAAEGEAPIAVPSQPRETGSGLQEAEPTKPPAPASAGTPAADEVKPQSASADPSSSVPADAKGKAPAETIRIKAEKLDDLIKLIGELVSYNNRLKQRLAEVKEMEKVARRTALLTEGLSRELLFHNAGIEIIEHSANLHAGLKRLLSSIKDDSAIEELLTYDLQEKALTLRMFPFSTVFDSFPRMVRDMAKSMKKEVDFVVEGGGIELDKKIIEKIGDPLVHMIRNSLDHGMEGPEERVLKGKPRRGVVRLAACYDAGSVVIELNDDGRGIALEKIREKALRKKLYSEEALNIMPESEIIDLIFRPGFSTSEIITDMSGRGVGLDVVKKNIIEDLRGSIKVDTRIGAGTTFTIRLPLTLSIMRLFLVESGSMTFAVPAHYISEITMVNRTELIPVVDRTAVRLREELIPAVRLDSILKLPNRSRSEFEEVLLLVVHTGNEKVGVSVDALLDDADMVIKPLPSHMKNIPLVSGVTITGKDEIINILHVPGLITAAKGLKEERAPEGGAAAAEPVRILVVDDSVSTREIEKNILEAYGYQVDIAIDGQDGLEKLKDKKYDLLVTDVEMPRLDGFSLTERIRNDSRLSDLPIIIVTSLAREEDRRRGIRVGANAYIVKGAFDQTTLLETVQNLVG